MRPAVRGDQLFDQVCVLAVLVPVGHFDMDQAAALAQPGGLCPDHEDQAQIQEILDGGAKRIPQLPVVSAGFRAEKVDDVDRDPRAAVSA